MATIYIPPSSNNYVTITQLNNYATINSLNSGLSTKLNTASNSYVQGATGVFNDVIINTINSGTGVFNSVSVGTGFYTNLTVSNLLTQTRMYAKYIASSGQTIAVGANTLQFPTASISTNVTGLTVSGSGNTTFTNTSGVTKYWSVTAVGFAFNTDMTNTARLTTSVFLNGSTTGIANSIFTPYSLTVGGGPQCSGILSVANGSSITVIFTTTVMTTSTSINSATLFIVEV